MAIPTTLRRLTGCLLPLALLAITSVLLLEMNGPGIKVQLGLDPGGIGALRSKRAATDLYFLAIALECYRADHGQYPIGGPLQLKAALAPAYVPDVPLSDPWKRPYGYVGLRNSTYVLGSLGCDGQFGAAGYEGFDASVAADLFLINGHWVAQAARWPRPEPVCKR